MRVRGLVRVGVVRLIVWILCAFLAAQVTAQVPVRKGFPPQKGVVPPGKAPVVPPGKAPVAPPVTQPKGAKLPEPEEVTLETKDGMTIKATYYGGTAKKEAVPVIMVHGFEGQRGDYHALAMDLQKLGHASIVPDLRGHGQSKMQKRPDGTPFTLETSKLTRPVLEAMNYDIAACKSFLMEKNNAGELNIEELCVVGAELGAVLAVRFAAADWSLQDLPAYKQGKDVKALVLLSPTQAVKAVTMRDALAFPPVQSKLSIMFVVGTNDSKSSSDTRKMYDSMLKHHPWPEEKEERRKAQDLFLVQRETNLSGTKLLSNALGIRDAVASFIDLRLVSHQADFPWQERNNPLGN